MRIALCGNPNVGKTTLFNRITRSNAPVGNWHGVTVEVKTKRMKGNSDIIVSDLPGSYSLTARTKEEAITRDEILFGDYDVFICVAEVNNLRRNLYFLTQILEAGKKTALVVNMMDEARGKTDLELISRRLDIPVIGASERYDDPTEKIAEAARSAVSSPAARLPYLRSPDTAAAAERLRFSARREKLDEYFAAVKLSERDAFIAQKLNVNSDGCSGCAKNSNGCFTCANIKSRDEAARRRYAFIDGVLNGAAYKKRADRVTEKLDKIVLGKFALPVFFIIMSLVFVITFEVGKPLSALLSKLTECISAPIRSAAMPEVLRSLLCDGIISGVGSVLGFMPQVLLLFILTALLQDSGYMSRVAFVTDDFFKAFGISGRAAFSLVLGLGCSATAVLSTRGIAGENSRRRTAFVLPFFPCNARLSVFTAVSAYFGLPGITVAGLYILGFLTALLVLKIMRVFGKRKDEPELLMEIPPFRRPSARRVAKSVGYNALSFLSRIGTVVLGVSVIMWALCNFSIRNGFTGGVENSIMSSVAGSIAPVFKPLGFGNWRAVTALISGVVAKETVVSVIASLGGMNAVFDSALSAVSFLIFTALYTPCVATVAAIAKENGVKNAVLSVAASTALAYIAALVFYTLAMAYSADKRLFFIIAAAAAVVITAFAAAKIIRRSIKTRKADKRTSNG